MGKSGGRKKKGGSNQVSINDANSNSVPDNSDAAVDLVFPLCLERMVHEFKEEGNKRFHSKDFIGALQQYDIALELAPQNHLDRAIFHSNRAACFMQMKPIDYETVNAECSLAIQVQPRFVRPLLRRALAYEAIGKHDMAMQDVQVVLRDDPNHPDALMIAQRVRTALGPRQEAQQDLQSHPSSSALGASAVRGAPIGGLGPCLPARPVAMKGGGSAGAGGPVLPAVSKQEKQQTVSPAENRPEQETQFPKVVLKPANGTSISSNTSKANQKATSVPLPVHGQRAEAVVRWRPLKLVYYHDIRLAQMPVNCNFRVLRETVTKRFPSSKSVLIKYKDNDGDLVTITSTPELRLAESSVDKVIVEDPEDKAESIGMLRLHVVEVSPEQELPLLEEELEKKVPKEKSGAGEDPECEELKMDDWLSELCGSHVGIDSDAHIDLHELGMKFCSEALKEAVTSDGAWTLALATSKYFLSKFTLQTAWNVGKYGIEAGTSLVPASVPRPIARISVTIVALSVSLFILKSFVSTVFFVLATMGLTYFIFIAVNKGEGPRGNGGTTSTPRSLTTKYYGFEI